ncbi:MAG TPA: CAP domain-containing protein [Acidimicrobiales bacterium]|nr:CAP domain-containing protein [Acidimicrobiales bacterium]
MRRVARALAAGIALAAGMGAWGASSAAPAAALWTATCPGAQCPYAPPTATEQAFAADVLARLDAERAQPARDYPDGGATQALAPLAEDPALQQAAQAAAEHLAATGVLEDYSGPFPAGEYATGENAGGPGFDSAGEDLSVMESPGHAGAVLSAASDVAGIGVACDGQGRAWEVELFADVGLPAWQAGQQRLQAELAANSVYAQSGGTVLTVPEPAADGGGTDDAHFVYPTEPIAAGGPFATGVDWTCQGPLFPPGSASANPLPQRVVGMAGAGGGYELADAQGAVSVHGGAAFLGAANGLPLAAPIVGMAADPATGGYWLVAADGGIFAFGAPFLGSMGNQPLNQPIVGMAADPATGGYWLVAADGGIFAFGAPFLGADARGA